MNLNLPLEGESGRIIWYSIISLGPDYMRVFNPGVEFQPTLPS